MKNFPKIILAFVVTVALLGCASGSGELMKMNETACVQQGGVWGQQEDLYEDGSFDVYFACSCPQGAAGKSMVIFEGSPGVCK